MSIKAKNLKIDIKTLGPKGEKDEFILTEIKPDYAYVDNKPGDQIGYKYTILLINNGYEKIDVKIPGKQLLFETDINQMVTLDGVELSAYVMNGQLGLTCRATGIHLADDSSSNKQDFKVKSS